jgi:transposase
MGNPAGVKRDFKALERRRLQAARLLAQGLPEAEVARRVGVHRQSVNRWQQQLAESGSSALRRAGRAGRKPQLQASDLHRIEAGLQRGPQALGYATGLWTTRRVVELIEQVSGVRYTTVHAWRILRQLQWSCQRPVGRAWERDEVAIRRWKKKRWPELKKKPENGAKPSSLSTKAD